MIERFNGRIADVMHQTQFPTVAALTETLTKYEQIYNQYIPQRALGHIAPVQALKNWRKAKPDLFHKRVNNHTGLDRYSYKGWHQCQVGLAIRDFEGHTKRNISGGIVSLIRFQGRRRQDDSFPYFLLTPRDFNGKKVHHSSMI